MLECYVWGCVLFTTVCILGIIGRIVWDLAGWVFDQVKNCLRQRQAPPAEDFHLCPICFERNKDNRPVKDKTGKVLAGGCEKCWKLYPGRWSICLDTGTSNFDAAVGYLAGENSPEFITTDYRPGVMRLAEIRTAKNREKEGGK